MNGKELLIMLADDDQDDCLLFKDALEELPVLAQLTTVHSGEQLMKLLNKAQQLPDMLFLDLNMPRKNGFACLEEIKENEKFKHFPVIILSTSFEQDVVTLLYKKGAQHYIRKPNNFTQLTYLIHSVIKFVAQPGFGTPSKENFVISQESCDHEKS